MTATQNPAPADSNTVRDNLLETLRIDLIGPRPSDQALQHERLKHAPSRWYLTGFLVPTDAPLEQRGQDSEEELDEPIEPFHGSDDSTTPDRGSGKRNYRPSSVGMSILVDERTKHLEVDLAWGDYAPVIETEKPSEAGAGETQKKSNGSKSQLRFAPWVREPRAGRVAIDLSIIPNDGKTTPFPVRDSGGLSVECLVRSTEVRTVDGIVNVRAVSLFAVNRRPPASDDALQDTAFAFQVEMSIKTDRPLVRRANLQGHDSRDWDERLSDLHYRDVAEYAVGHNISTRCDTSPDGCRRVHTEWMPRARVARVEPSPIPDVEFRMEELGELKDRDDAARMLGPLVQQYREWIDGQRQAAAALAGRRREVADELIARAEQVATRVQAGIDLIDDAQVRYAFRIANRAMGAAARRHQAAAENKPADQVAPPAWRPFQLAYILMNLRGIADPTHIEREIVDLLFFPTGGGKTEAYLGLAAFTLVLRRLRDPDPTHRGLSVLMRYTLRLLTLDQLGRAAALICALELEREKSPNELGEWPFEIALWVGRAATPNQMGSAKDGSRHTARSRTLGFARDTSREPPLPIRECPWCGTSFGKHSFKLDPGPDKPDNLKVICANRRCDFNAKRPLPIVAVDEPIYARVPSFMIATADKFAALPWTGETAAFFRGGDPANPRPPDLIIQDELHLISGPLGTMAGLYETAIDHLCARSVGEKQVRPKIIASTATVRLANKQIKALFNRSVVRVFPAPGIDRRNSFFAKEAGEEESSARLYLGIAAQGCGPKVIFLRSMITLLGTAQTAWDAAGTRDSNPADPYMTAITYFNALRELGSARRIVEDEINVRLQSYAERNRAEEPTPRFANRRIAFEPVELTSRVSTTEVAEAKRRLALRFWRKDRVDVALATNMISVGLDITRLGLMVVSGQPKTSSEYIQATSRVGRDPGRPGLVVALLNVHKPRDRSHYERFSSYHESFYRSVEATSVTPFSPRALDRGLAAVTVALARLGIRELTPTLAARDVDGYEVDTTRIARAIGERAGTHSETATPELADEVTRRAQSLLDDWAKLAHGARESGVEFGYRSGKGVSVPLLREMIDPNRATLDDIQLQFRAPRSLRDVEPSVLLGVKTPEEQDLE